MEFWEKKEYEHVYDAMKRSKEEMNDAINGRKLMFFETVPLNFAEVGYQGDDAEDSHGEEQSSKKIRSSKKSYW